MNRWIAVLAALIALAACGDDHDGGGPSLRDSAVTAGDAGRADAAADDTAPEACDEHADAGSGCAEGKNCIAGQCRWNICGDGVIAGDEVCDDGNAVDGDECHPDCTRDTARCMDGLIQEPEECDDGNWFEADRCSNRCTLNVCGNGRIDLDEECDDANLVDDDGCSNLCRENRCRNGRVDPGEECDDGNREHRDGCTNACKVVLCGNGTPEEWEECDDANGVDDDACANTCTSNVCGNLRVDPGEACDGDSAEAQCSDDCSMVIDNSACLDCLRERCDGDDYDFTGYGQLYSHCFMNEGDPEFGQLCRDFVDCAFASQCWRGSEGDNFAYCICGNASYAMCQGNMGIDGACWPQFLAASQGANFEQALVRWQDIEYPTGGAIWLLQCTRTECGSECGDTQATGGTP